MKDGNGKKAAKGNKMSEAARKAWETRRKKYGNGKSKKREKSRKQGQAEEGEAEVIVEQLRKGYRRGELVRKGKRNQRKNSVVMDDKYRTYLWGQKWAEEVMVRKLWAMAKELAKEMVWGKQLVVAK